jgi:hypothetical protein
VEREREREERELRKKDSEERGKRLRNLRKKREGREEVTIEKEERLIMWGKHRKVQRGETNNWQKTDRKGGKRGKIANRMKRRVDIQTDTSKRCKKRHRQTDW